MRARVDLYDCDRQKMSVVAIEQLYIYEILNADFSKGGKCPTPQPVSIHCGCKALKLLVFEVAAHL